MIIMVVSVVLEEIFIRLGLVKGLWNKDCIIVFVIFSVFLIVIVSKSFGIWMESKIVCLWGVIFINLGSLIFKSSIDRIFRRFRL